MNQFFDYNNNVFRVLGGLADCLILGALIALLIYAKVKPDLDYCREVGRHSGGVPCGQ